MNPSLLLDLLLPAALLWLAWYSLASADLFRAIILFIAFSLLLALIWARLEAPDVALAEAAIGAGVTGSLLLVALGRLQPTDRGARRGATDLLIWKPYFPVILSAIALLAAGSYLLWTLRLIPPENTGLAAMVGHQLADSGVDHPLTAVLLNFRGYDTMLEVGVLVLAVIGIWSLGEAPPFVPKPFRSPVLQSFHRILLPILVIIAGYLLWLGSHAPGGAFQAAALLAAGIILTLFTGRSLPAAVSGLPLRFLLVLGFLAFLATSLLGPLTGKPLLHYPPGWAKPLIITVESLLTISIALTLAGIVTGGGPGPARPYPPPRSDPAGEPTK